LDSLCIISTPVISSCQTSIHKVCSKQLILEYATTHICLKCLLKTFLHYFIWILLRPRVMRILLLLMPSHVYSASSAAECQAGSVAKVAAIHKIVQSWQDLQVKGFILHGCDKDRNQHCTKFVQVCWKFCVCLQVQFTALHPEHQLHFPYSTFPCEKEPSKCIYILLHVFM